MCGQQVINSDCACENHVGESDFGVAGRTLVDRVQNDFRNDVGIRAARDRSKNGWNTLRDAPSDL